MTRNGWQRLETRPSPRFERPPVGPVVTGAGGELTHEVYRTGWRSYALRVDGRPAMIRRRGLVHARYDVDLGHDQFTAWQRMSGEVEIIDVAGRRITHTSNLACPRVDVHVRDRQPLSFTRLSWGGQWLLVPPDGTWRLRFSPTRAGKDDRSSRSPATGTAAATRRC